MKQYYKLMSTHWPKNLVAFCMILFLTSNIVVAQGSTLSGKVVSRTYNTPIIGATVMVDGTTIGTSTDIDGNFTISNAPANGNITISYIGYTTVTESIIDGKNYTISLNADTQMIDDVLVVGYGTMRKKEVTGAVTRVESEQISKLSTPDVGSALQGQIAGVNVQASSGQPGAIANVQIRGISSVTGSNTPLYVVDGVPYEGDPGLSPQEIESIDVLKDAASAAIYGTRGAGGVILITTKGGEEGDIKITFDGYYGVQSITSSLDLLNANEYMYISGLKSTASDGDNGWWSSIYNLPVSYMNDTYIMDLIEKDNQPIYNAALTVSGGAKGFSYSVVGNYYNQEGVIMNSSYNKFNVRANTSLVKNKWTITANITAQNSNQQTPASNLYKYGYKYFPTSPELDLDAWENTSDDTEDNQISSLSSALGVFLETNTTETRSVNTNFMASYEILPKLKFSTRYGSGYKISLLETINPIYALYKSNGTAVTPTQSGIEQTTKKNTSYSLENMLTYAKDFGKNSLNATVVFSAESYGYEMYSVAAKDLITNDIYELSATTGSITIDSANRETTILGMLGRLQYSYDDRYMASASIRRDGSSRFAKNNRWGYFPSFSAGWNISEEEFWGELKNSINGIKLRASYGTTGNQNFDDYLMDATISTGYDYAFATSTGGSTMYYGSTQTQYSNAEISWETTTQTNIGVDLSFLDSRLTFTADVYQSDKRNMLFGLDVPYSSGSGGSSVTMNVGNMTNKGIELAVGWRGNTSKLNYYVNTTFSRNVNTITEMSSGNEEVALGQVNGVSQYYYVTYLKQGYEAGAYFLKETAGVINTDAKLEEYQKIDSDAMMGDIIYVDQNEDGSITDADRVYCGSGTPEAEFGLNGGVNWKSFDLSANLYASLGSEIFNASTLLTSQLGTDRQLLDCWSIDNQLSTIAVRRANNDVNYAGDNDLFIEDGSYLRLRNVVLGYSLPKKIVSKAKMSKLRVYVAADNIWTLTGYSGYDPEVGNDGLKTRGLDKANYPISAQIRGGIQVEF